MQARRVIEIVQSAGYLPAELILTGYWASQSGLVVFILNGVTPQAVDLVLDPIVVTLPMTIPGVLYVDVGTRRAFARLCFSPRRFTPLPDCSVV